QPGRFDGCLAAMLAAITGTGIRHDHADPLLRYAKSAGQAAADTEGLLRAGPDRELSIFPFRHGSTWLQRCVGDIRDGVGCLELVVGSGQALLDGALARAGPASEALSPSRILLQ